MAVVRPVVHSDEHPHHYTDQDEQDDDTQRRPDPAAAVPVAIITTPPFCWAVRRCRRATDDTGCAISSILPTDRAAGGRWQVAGGRVEPPGVGNALEGNGYL